MKCLCHVPLCGRNVYELMPTLCTFWIWAPLHWNTGYGVINFLFYILRRTTLQVKVGEDVKNECMCMRWSVVQCMSCEYEVRKVEGKTGAGISLALTKTLRGLPGLTSPSDGRIAINSTYVKCQVYLGQKLAIKVMSHYFLVGSKPEQLFASSDFVSAPQWLTIRAKSNLIFN